MSGFASLKVKLMRSMNMMKQIELMIEKNMYRFNINFYRFFLTHNYGFEDRERAAVFKKVKQLRDENCFTPVFIEESTSLKKQRAQIALIFLNEKRDAIIKAREVHDGKPTRV